MVDLGNDLLTHSQVFQFAVDILNDRVLPFFFGEGIAISAVLTDNGKEYKGKEGEHSYELFLALHHIHTE